MPPRTRQEAPRPADRCPYDRPFQEDFSECRAYLPTQFIPLDIHHRPMRPAWTCWNLEVRTHPDRRESFYAACRIGDAQDRRDWVAKLDANRVAVMRSLRRRFIHATEPEFAAFWAAKAAAVQAAAEHRALGDANVRNAARRLHDAFAGFFAAEAEPLATLGLSRSLSMEIVDAWLEILIARASGEADWRLPAELVARLPAQARPFYEWNSDS